MIAMRAPRRSRCYAAFHHGLLAWAVAATIAGCAADPFAPASEESAPLAPDGQVLRPTPLPDLSEMTAAVRDQIRERYSSLTAAIEHPGATSELSEAYGEMGNVLMAARYGDAPEPFYLNAQALAPSDRRWPYYLGHLYTTRGAFAQAAASFEQALALRADDVPTLISLGEVHLAQGRPQAAEPLFTQALSLQPGSVWARIGLGRAASTRQDYVRAVEHLEEALAVDPQAANIHYPLAMAYRGLGELEKAEAHLQQRDSGTIRQPDPLMQAMRDSLQSPSAYEREGIQALGSGDWEAAAAAFRRGIELAPANPSLRHRLGTTLFMLGNEREGPGTVRRGPAGISGVRPGALQPRVAHGREAAASRKRSTGSRPRCATSRATSRPVSDSLASCDGLDGRTKRSRSTRR